MMATESTEEHGNISNIIILFFAVYDRDFEEISD